MHKVKLKCYRCNKPNSTETEDTLKIIDSKKEKKGK